MDRERISITVRGRYLGVLVLVIAQAIIGIIHVVFGFWIFSSIPNANGLLFVDYSSSTVYSIYTIIFGACALIFSAGLWIHKMHGWIGTVAILVFVVLADTLTLLNLPAVPGIPKFAAYGEITYSILVLTYLIQPHILAKYGIRAA